MPDRAGRLSVTNVLVLLTVAAVAALTLPKLLGGGRDSGGDRGAPVETARTQPSMSAAPTAAALPRVDPAPYASAIRELETILYRESPPDFSTGDQISRIASEIGAAVMEREPRATGTRAGAALVSFASRVGTEADVGYATVDLPRARRQWEAVRNEVFEPAAWFKGSTGDLAAAQTRPVPVAHPTAVLQLNDVANQLERLVTIGRDEAARFAEPYDLRPGSPELRNLQQQYVRWGRDWTSRINTVLDLMPNLGSSAEQNSRSAFSELYQAAQALNQVGQTANQYGVPVKSEREMHFGTASARIQQARQYLSRLR